VNVGENIGVEATYGSGTVGAAIQGGVLGLRSLALSMETGGDVGLMRRVAVAAAESSAAFLDGVLAVSVNIPARWGGGLYCARKLAKASIGSGYTRGLTPAAISTSGAGGRALEEFEPAQTRIISTWRGESRCWGSPRRGCACGGFGRELGVRLG
jgi:5'-nucleotidase